MVPWMPAASACKRTIITVTPAIASERNSVRRPWRNRLRKAIRRLIMGSLLGLHRLPGRDTHGQPGRVEAGKHADDEHDPERDHHARGPELGEELRPGEEEAGDVAGRRDA